MKNAKKIKVEKLTPVAWGYLEMRGDEEICPCVLGVGSQLAVAATLIGDRMTLQLDSYDVEWRLWDTLPCTWERDAQKWEEGQQTRMA